ncbi:MAG: phasin family protein [Deltaproteobacteria bacterium]|nr:phasin family protein [Deltaproteobacteria bacterium]
MTKKKVEQVTDDVLSMAGSIWLAGLGALATAQDEGNKVFSRLVSKGQGVDLVNKEDMEEQVDKARQQVSEQVSKAKGAVSGALGDLASSFDDQLGAAMHRLGVPTRDEIKTLTERVEALTEKVDQLRPQPAPKTRTRRTASSSAKKTTSSAATKAKKTVTRVATKTKKAAASTASKAKKAVEAEA